MDLSRVRPHFLSENLARNARPLVTMCCGDACPCCRLAKLDWPLVDPQGKPLDGSQDPHKAASQHF